MNSVGEYVAMRALATVSGWLPWGAGQYRIARRVAALNRWPPGSIRVQRLRSGARVGLDLGDYHQAIAFLVRDYSPSHRRYIANALPTRGILFDVGAHVGLITFGVGARRPDVIVHAFEPNPSNAEAWRRNQRLNPQTSTHLAEAGVSDHEGEASFGVCSDSGSGVIGYSDEHRVALVSLDDYCARNDIEHIDFLKVDVQGHEIQVFEGATRLLRTHAIDRILVEVTLDPSETITSLLGSYGYRGTPVKEVGLRGLLSHFVAARPVDDLVFSVDSSAAGQAATGDRELRLATD